MGKPIKWACLLIIFCKFTTINLITQIQFCKTMRKIIYSLFVLFYSFVNAQISSVTKEFSFKANPLLNSINNVAFDSTGNKVVSGTNCHPASIRIFDVANGTLLWDHEVGSAFMCIMGVSFSNNSKYLLAIEEMGNILVFDNTGTNPVLVDTIKTLTSYAFSLSVKPDNSQFVAGCSSGRIKVFNLPSGTLAHNVVAHSGYVTTVAYSPNGNYIVTGGSDDKVKIWSNTGTLLFTCSGHTADVTNVRVTPDNQYVISSSQDKKIIVWKISDGTQVRVITGHTRSVNGIDLSPDGSKIVSASSDSTCKIWDFNTGNEILTFAVKDSGQVNTVAWSPNGDKIVTGNLKSDLVVWKVNTSSSIQNSIKNAEFDFTLFPNPSSDIIQLSLPQFILDNYQVQVTDLQGKVVFNAQNNAVIPVHNLDSGVYYVCIRHVSKGSCTRMFVKY